MRQPPQPTFTEKSAEYMAAWRWFCACEPGSDEQAQSLDAISKATEHCPRCGARATNGHCWLGCGNEAAQASQRQVDTAIIAAYKPGDSDDEPACGNFTREEVDDMRYPTF